MNCILCKKIESIELKNSELIIDEFKNSYWILGDHQFFHGYSQLVLKNHVRDLFQLSEDIQIEVFKELMNAEKASRLFLNPWKMNLSLYGNAVPHIHWHLFPRYEDEVDCKKVPWFYMNEFDSKPTLDTDYRKLIKGLRENL